MNRVNIEAERGRLQMTKTDMCQELGVTLKTYNGYIRGAVIPSDILEQLRKMTGQSIDYSDLNPGRTGCRGGEALECKQKVILRAFSSEDDSG